MSKQNKQTKVVTTVTKSNRKARGRRNQRRQQQQQQMPLLHMAPCTKLYAKALVNPFSVQGSPCIPDSIIMPSYKFTTKARGVFSTGELGTGFCVIDPFQMVINDGQTSLLPDRQGGAIKYTSTDYPDANGIALTYAEDFIYTANSNSLFTADDFTGPTYNRQYRLVGCGMRIKYIGSNFRNQGRVIVFRKQSNSTLAVGIGYSADELLQDNYNSSVPVSRRDTYVYYVPDDPDLIAYHTLLYYYPPISNNAAHYCMGFLVVGGDITEPQSWEFEAVAHFEMIGGPGLSLSKSDGDPVGHDIILSSLPNTTPTQSPSTVEQSVLSQFVKGFTETTHQVALSAGRMLPGLAANTVGSYLFPMNQRQITGL